MVRLRVSTGKQIGYYRASVLPHHHRWSITALYLGTSPGRLDKACLEAMPSLSESF